MMVDYVEIKNRQLVILNEKKYDVSLIERNDIIRIRPGRALVDSIVIHGSMKVQQSARTGCEDIIELGKGDRL
jgi:cation transport ATPase